MRTIILDKLIAIAYLNYLYKWTHDRGFSVIDFCDNKYIGDMPVCMNEFYNNEFQDKDIVSNYLNDKDIKQWEKYFEDTE